MHSQQATANSGQAGEVLARQGMRLPQIVLKRLREAGIYCQPTLSIEYQNVARRHVLRGVESGGAVAALGADTSFLGEGGEPLPWLQRVDSIGVNGVHAVVVSPVLLRLEILRIERTYDLLITRHSLTESGKGTRPRLASAILFYGRRGSLEMELWDKDSDFRGTACPVFYTRAGESLTLPEMLQPAVAAITAAVCCLQCRHCHVLGPRVTSSEVSGIAATGLLESTTSAFSSDGFET
jgi:hypothetical protein